MVGGDGVAQTNHCNNLCQGAALKAPLRCNKNKLPSPHLKTTKDEDSGAGCPDLSWERGRGWDRGRALLLGIERAFFYHPSSDGEYNLG
jgi:hypothetical protein